VKNRSLFSAALLCLLLLLFAVPAFTEGQPALSLDPAELTLEKGKSLKLACAFEHVDNPKSVKLFWESSDPAVARVNKAGTVKAMEGGSVVITCTAALADGSELTASAAVTVTVPVQSVKILTKANTPIRPGETLQAEYAVTPENATDKTVSWTSSDENVLRVDENGAVTAVSAGKAAVTATSANGKTAKVNLYVPTLVPSADTFSVTATESVYHFTYCGGNFDQNVQIKASGKCFEFSLIRNDPDIGVSFIALQPGEGTLTVTDSKDAGAKFTVAVTVTDSAFPAGRRLLIRSAALDPESGKLTVSWTNTGSETVTEAQLRVIPRDENGNALVIGEGYIEDIPDEERVYHAAVKADPGQTVSASFPVGTAYPGTAGADLAFDRIVTTIYAADGSVAERSELILPDDCLCWYSSKDQAYTAGPETGDPYAPPPEEAFARAAEAPLGFRGVAVTGELAEAYGFAYSGVMVVSVAKDSAAEAMGLEPGDLIYAANGLYYAHEPYFLTLGCAEIAAGNPVTLLIESDNEFYELILTPDAENEEETP
jgi:hypothetical protein